LFSSDDKYEFVFDLIKVMNKQFQYPFPFDEMGHNRFPFDKNQKGLQNFLNNIYAHHREMNGQNYYEEDHLESELIKLIEFNSKVFSAHELKIIQKYVNIDTQVYIAHSVESLHDYFLNSNLIEEFEKQHEDYSIDVLRAYLS